MQIRNTSTQTHSKLLLVITTTLFILRIIASFCPDFTGSKEISSEAKEYLSQAISIMQAHSIKAKEIDFREFKEQTFADAARARTPEDTYDALRKAIKRLGDHHSFLSTDKDWGEIIEGKKNRSLGMAISFPSGVVAQILPNSAAEKARIKLGDTVLELENIALSNLPEDRFYKILSGSIDGVQRKTIKAKIKDSQGTIKTLDLAFSSTDITFLPEGKLLFNNIGYITLPMQITLGDSIQQYADRAQEIIKELDANNVCGWIIDLRHNQGGNMWPMLAGIGPILGEGAVGSYVYLDSQNRPQWSYREGKAFDQNRVIVAVPLAYKVKNEFAPVAILTSNLTASSGEAMVVSFKGRSKTRFFGESTYGVPTANISYPLSDGAKIVLTVALEADRTGKVYSEKIAPDEEVKIDWQNYATEQDSVVVAANNWLKAQCK